MLTYHQWDPQKCIRFKFQWYSKDSGNEKYKCRVLGIIYSVPMREGIIYDPFRAYCHIYAITTWLICMESNLHGDVIKWKHFPRYWSFVQGIHRSPVNSPHKGQWRGALMFSLICVWINGWVSNREAGDLRRNSAYYDVTVMRVIFTQFYLTVSIIFSCSTALLCWALWKVDSHEQCTRYWR